MVRRRKMQERSRSNSRSNRIMRRDPNVMNRNVAGFIEPEEMMVAPNRLKRVDNRRKNRVRRKGPSPPSRVDIGDPRQRDAEAERALALDSSHPIYSTYDLIYLVARNLIRLQESRALPMDVYSFRRKLAGLYQGPDRLRFNEICNMRNLHGILRHLWLDHSIMQKQREYEYKKRINNNATKFKRERSNQKDITSPSDIRDQSDIRGVKGSGADEESMTSGLNNEADAVDSSTNEKLAQANVDSTQGLTNAGTTKSNTQEEHKTEVAREPPASKTAQVAASDANVSKRKSNQRADDSIIKELFEHFKQMMNPSDLSFERVKFETSLLDLSVDDGVLRILFVRTGILRRLLLRNMRNERIIDLGLPSYHDSDSVIPDSNDGDTPVKDAEISESQHESIQQEKKESPPITADTLYKLLKQNTAREIARVSEFHLYERSGFREICIFGTRANCRLQNPMYMVCRLIHFKQIILPNTLVQLGDCSYLDTCRHIETCRFVHYQIESDIPPRPIIDEVSKGQWICCDVRKLDFSIFNPYVSVVMADPPWDIHMDLPYGTMKDSEMKGLKVQNIQDEGLLFLWVTGRTLEVGRECMEIWGYRQVDEIVWVKTNQLQRIIRTGRTGHWLNHSKEHCLIGIKGNPVINKYIDCDVVVSEVRETSRKPDEIYRLIERMVPGALKLEIFGRSHNVRNNWITLGNQLNGYNLTHPIVKRRYEEHIAKTGASNAEVPASEQTAD